MHLNSQNYEFVVNAISEGVVTLNLDGYITAINPAAEKLMELSASEASGTYLSETHFFKKECLEGVDYLNERCVHITDENGEVRYVELKSELLLDESNEPKEHILLLKDVTESRRLSEHLKIDTSKDSLTGIHNRRYFIQKLAFLLEKDSNNDQRHALIYLDLDQFKVVNEACGHARGDELLQVVTRLILSKVRATDIVCRLGGDEFGVILVDCATLPAVKVAESIAEAISQYSFTSNDDTYKITSSIGVLDIENQYSEASEVINDAEIACNLAIEGGRNRVHSYAKSDVGVELYKNNVNWVARINEALKLDRFILYFQSIAPLTNDQGVHGEVLIRLQERNGDIVMPGDFMPCVERFFIASKVDAYVVDKVFDLFETQQEVVENVSMVSVNLSGQSVNDKSFREYLYAKVASTIIPLEKICFEITETIALSYLEEVVPFIQTLKKLGVKFALDDFGNGASSFSYLRKLPVDYLKIDGQFIVNLDKDEVSRLTVDCLAKVAKLTGAETIAEWVETEAVYQELQRLGVDYMQGYYHHKPEPMDQFLAQAYEDSLEPNNCQKA